MGKRDCLHHLLEITLRKPVVLLVRFVSGMAIIQTTDDLSLKLITLMETQKIVAQKI